MEGGPPEGGPPEGGPPPQGSGPPPQGSGPPPEGSGPPGSGPEGTGPPDGVQELNVAFMNFYSRALSWDYRDRDMDFCITMIPTLVVLVVACVALNGVVHMFYRGKGDVVSLVYTMLSGTDILVGLGSIFTTLTLIFYLSYDLQHTDPGTTYTSFIVSSYLSFIITSITIRVSVFLNVMLSVIRTMMIRNPFSQPNKKLVVGFTGGITFFWLLFGITDCITINDYSITTSWSDSFSNTTTTIDARKQYLYLWYFIFTSLTGYYSIRDFIIGLVSWSPFDQDNMVDYEEYIETGIPYTIFTVTFIAPTLVALVCLLTQMTYLRKGKIAGVKNKNTEVTVTIVMLTAVFVACNMAMIIYTSITAFNPGTSKASALMKLGKKEAKGRGKDIMTSMVNFYRGMFIMSLVVPLINSILSPAILILRGSALRAYISQGLACQVSPDPSAHITRTATISGTMRASGSGET